MMAGKAVPPLYGAHHGGCRRKSPTGPEGRPISQKINAEMSFPCQCKNLFSQAFSAHGASRAVQQHRFRGARHAAAAPKRAGARNLLGRQRIGCGARGESIAAAFQPPARQARFTSDRGGNRYQKQVFSGVRKDFAEAISVWEGIHGIPPARGTESGPQGSPLRRHAATSVR